jgi:hypothetical protein
MGFWPAAVLLSAIFGYSHLGNSGENWLGVFNASMGGLLFCLLLRRSGNLWIQSDFMRRGIGRRLTSTASPTAGTPCRGTYLMAISLAQAG